MRTSTPGRAAVAKLDRLCVAICHDVRGPVAAAGAALHQLAALSARARRAPASTSGRAPAEARRAGVDRGTDAGSGAVVDTDAGLPEDLLAIARHSLRQAEELLASLPGLMRAVPARAPIPLALEDVLRAAARDVELELRLVGGHLRLPTTDAIVLGDLERLRVAWRNLLSNAIRYRRRGVPPEIRVGAERRGTWWLVSIVDNGIGIPPQDRRRVFRPFERGGSTCGGSGLGLAIARQAIEASGGRISVRTRDRGACFEVRLRAAESAGSANRS